MRFSVSQFGLFSLAELNPERSADTREQTHAPARGAVQAPLPGMEIAAANILPDRLPTVRHLDPAAALTYRTPVQEHLVSADGKAAGILTLLGIMFTVLARCSDTLSVVLRTQHPVRLVCLTLLAGFAAMGVLAVIQAFRTITPRFPKAPFSLAFFGDIAKLSREDYVSRVEALTPAEAIDHMLSFNHTASRICIAKMRQLRRGFRCFEIAFAFWLPLVTLLAIKGLSS